MTKKILFVVVSMMLLIIVYVSSLTGIIVERQAITRENLLKEAETSGDFGPYLKYATELYKPLSIDNEVKDSDYDIKVYQVIESDNNGLYTSLIVFIRPIETVNFSDETFDELDQTAILVTNNSNTVYDSKLDPIFDDFSISYGLKTRGFYYYNFKTTAHGVFEVQLKDYDGATSFTGSVTFESLDFNFDFKDQALKEAYFDTLLLNGFEPNFTVDEVADMYEFNQHVWKAYLYSAIFLMLDVLFGYFFIFKKKH